MTEFQDYVSLKNPQFFYNFIWKLKNTNLKTK